MNTSPLEPPQMAQRAAIPHIFTQWEPGQFSRESPPLESVEIGIDTHDFLQPRASQRQELAKVDITSPATPGGPFLTTPENTRWGFDALRNTRRSPSELSAVDSIFELPSGPDDSPASSTNSSIIAELEDTSPVVLYSKKSALPGPHLVFQCATIPSRAAIKNIDNTIASIEADNRKLLTRAVTAEHQVRVLKEENFSLQRKIHHCEQHHRRKPRTVSSQPTLRRQHQQQSFMTPLSAYNDVVDKQQVGRHIPSARNPSTSQSHSAPIHKTLPPQRSPPSTPPTRPLPLPLEKCTPKMPPTGKRISTRPSPTRAPPRTPIQYSTLQTLSPTFSNQNISPTSPGQTISSPIPGSVYKHAVTHRGENLSIAPEVPIISLTEAQLKRKPLPPISPGVLHGNVHIGLGLDQSDLEKMGKRKKGFSVLFKKGKKGCESP